MTGKVLFLLIMDEYKIKNLFVLLFVSPLKDKSRVGITVDHSRDFIVVGGV